MRTIATALLGATLLSAPANASDLFGGSTKDAPASTASGYVFSWTGIYVGGVVGLGVGDAETEKSQERQEKSYSHVGDNDIDGAIYGAHAGYNLQRGNIVFGVEGGIYGTELDTDGQNLLFPVAHETEVDWHGRVIGRLGVTTGSTLFYGFGGVAIGDVTSTLTFGDESKTLSDEQHVGWTAGVGLEHVIGKGWIGRVEYAHVDLGEEKSSVSFGETDYDVNQDINWDQITVGLSYKF
jgi:outer membrane immunogenic protein